MRPIALVRDSTFGNARYVGDEPDVMAVLRELLPVRGDGTRLAVDGSLIGNIAAQLASLSLTTTPIVLSVGGNDALQIVELLSQPATSALEAHDLVADARDGLQRAMGRCSMAVLGRGLPTAICTIYEPAFRCSIPNRQCRVAGLNDIILHEAFMRRLPVLDLPLVRRSDEDLT
jgi:hypothetical protein